MKQDKTQTKTADTWRTPIEEIFMQHGLILIDGNKTGACIMPAPKRKPSVKPQEDTEEMTKNSNE